jgi:hypothetical protein
MSKPYAPEELREKVERWTFLASSAATSAAPEPVAIPSREVSAEAPPKLRRPSTFIANRRAAMPASGR